MYEKSLWLFAMPALALLAGCQSAQAGPAPESQQPVMYYADADHGGLFAKDPDVVRFDGRYLMYYTVRMPGRIGIGIAESDDLTDWSKVGELDPAADYEKNGLAAPAALVHKGQVHLFYQIYGNGPKDALCHAASDDGVHFERNPTNPIFAPTGAWNVGRAIDAEVYIEDGTAFLYGATRDPQMKRQMLFVATAPVPAGFVRDSWTQQCDGPILAPELEWETKCIEAPTLIKHGDRYFMFYAGGYNNDPQQIGVAVSDDGLAWERLSDKPLLPNGPEGAWNHSESGHPGVFVDEDGTSWLFFQGNNDNGKTWFLSKMRIAWDDAGLPRLIRPKDGRVYRLEREN
ncbi:MAG: glycoside hydrolase family 43 protein [Candidatus Hydrogenedentota bacterium]